MYNQNVSIDLEIITLCQLHLKTNFTQSTGGEAAYIFNKSEASPSADRARFTESQLRSQKNNKTFQKKNTHYIITSVNRVWLG